MTPLLDTTGWALIHFVWQGAAIAAATGAILRLLRNHSARARYSVACAGLAVMLAAPTLTARLLIDAARADERVAETTPAESGARPHVKRAIASYFMADGTAQEWSDWTSGGSGPGRDLQAPRTGVSQGKLRHDVRSHTCHRFLHGRWNEKFA